MPIEARLERVACELRVDANAILTDNHLPDRLKEKSLSKLRSDFISSYKRAHPAVYDEIRFSRGRIDRTPKFFPGLPEDSVLIFKGHQAVWDAYNDVGKAQERTQSNPFMLGFGIFFFVEVCFFAALLFVPRFSSGLKAFRGFCGANDPCLSRGILRCITVLLTLPSLVGLGTYYRLKDQATAYKPVSTDQCYGIID